MTDAATPFDRLGAHVAGVASDPWVAVAIASAAAGTKALSETRADHDLRLGLGRDLAAPGFGDAMVIGGWVAPVVVPGALWMLGVRFDDALLARAGAAALQAAGLTVALTAVLKVATGRPYPLHGFHPADPARFDHPEFASEWRPFRALGAWPSGHTSAAFAAATALTAATRSPWVGLATFPAAGAIAAGMLVGDHHWTSDVVAGALLGVAIGRNVGRAFAGEADDPPTRVAWSVVPAPGGATIALRGRM